MSLVQKFGRSCSISANATAQNAPMTHFDCANSNPARRSSAPAAMISQQPANQWIQKLGQLSQ